VSGNYILILFHIQKSLYNFDIALISELKNTVTIIS